ncbi:hypothetical protein A2716_05245 [candidate division WWE3 bacterium RIFCSPHIGHO2_01_FULL_40_23]|uniref:Gas vesicle protein n=1 Tax=candidate division WWE3 bacterium RIFCSPLOWO2_01_FULL_41_18 TaxID=1802625 RepID=A0A1F4VDR1_UNCKA|nr:MAG: hypothetical protein A2716_05245 [candidate division WWE3 bacterium RIFCSPHIGHO2_01_FULL_40_23]OGC55275.1 MAG: hypothetical protein A3A78_04855 [candidate division WWE3 bacterium RIFCSPLOWO2_01_FULL_41_18]
MKNNSLSKNKVLLPVGILIGALLGGVAGVLLAPASGKENRKKLKEITLKLKAELEKRLGEAKEITEESYTKMVNTIVDEYSKKEPIIKEQAGKLKEALKGRFKLSSKED